MSLFNLTEDELPGILKRPLWHFYAAGTVILLLTGWLWWAKFYTAPTHVFWSMIETSLSTSSYTTETNQSDGNNYIKQTTQVDTQAGVARSLTQLKQQSTEVKKEVVGTRTADYTKFLSILPATKGITAPVPDTSKIVNVWSKSDDSEQQTQTASSGHQLYAQTTLGIGLPVGSVPVAIADFSPRDRKDTIQRIRSENMYVPDFASVKKERKNGRQVYTYNVKIQTILYVRLMQALARHLQLNELDQVDPNAYSGGQPLQAKVSVDVLSHRLVSVDTGQGFTQTYSGYDIPLRVELPKDTITAAELQHRLDELGQ